MRNHPKLATRAEAWIQPSIRPWDKRLEHPTGGRGHDGVRGESEWLLADQVCWAVW